MKRLLPILFLAFLSAPMTIAKQFEGYEIVGYSESPSGATFTIIHANWEIKGTCGRYYGTQGTCDHLKSHVGDTIPWPQMMSLSPSTLEYNPDNSGTCVKNKDCEFLHITSQQELR